jgi:6-phosphogluconolactonase
MYAFVGCYTTPDRDGRGTGIGVYQMDPATGI